MNIRTRSATSSPVKKSAPAPATATPTTDQHGPVKVLVAPRSISTEARIIGLQHPRDHSPKRFLFCPKSGLYELTRIATPSSDLRSTLFAPVQPESSSSKTATITQTEDTASTHEVLSDGYINKDADVLTATFFDIVFLLISLIAPQEVTNKKPLFQPIDDLFEEHTNNDGHLRYVFDNGKDMVESAMTRICDSVDAGDEKMYRYNEDKVLRLLLDKADRVVRSGLPATMEEKFITRPLEAPILSVKTEVVTTVVKESTPTEGSLTTSQSFDSQSATGSSGASAVFSEISLASTTVSVAEGTVSDIVKHLQRHRTAFNFISASYLPPKMADRLRSMLLTDDSPVNYKPLEAHLKKIAMMKAEAAASRSISDFSRKRHVDDDEAAEIRLDKKRKQDEEAKKAKANESRGVRDLKKVNVTGMKKMSDFFTKKPAAAAKAKT